MIIHFQRGRIRGVTLVELISVMLIISILAALFLTAAARAFVHVKHVLGQ
jgi:prepilin-type N-terminal cleavage/methylation domain-containing protein